MGGRLIISGIKYAACILIYPSMFSLSAIEKQLGRSNRWKLARNIIYAKMNVQISKSTKCATVK